MGTRKLLAVGCLVLLGLGSGPERARAQGESLPPGTSLPGPTGGAYATLESAPYCAPTSARPRGLLQQPTSEGASPEHFTPFMLGDFANTRFNTFSDVKIAEGESPRPMSRAFYKFNYYNNLEKARFNNPLERVRSVDLYRNVFGLEQALFDNTVSLGLRVPFNTLDAEGKDRGPGLRTTDQGFTETEFGNISAVVKALLWEDRASGSLLSAGATLSFPTASSKQINPGMSTISFVQPYAGYIVQRGDFFVHGFTSVTLSIASAQSIVLFNDIGVGYYAYRNTSGTSFLTAVVPTLELHVFTPLRQVDPNANVFGTSDNLRLHDIVNVTAGTTFEFSNRATLGVGAAVPLTGPKPFDFEALVQLNYRF